MLLTMIGQNGKKAAEENNDEQDSLARYDIDLCSVDKIVLAFWYLVQSGLLQKSYIFYEEEKAFYFRALSSLIPSNTNFSQEYPALTA